MKRRKILFITAWYPSAEHAVSGTFVKEHAQAVSLYNDVAVIHGIPRLRPANPLHLSDSIEKGIRTLQFRYMSPPIIYGIFPTYFLGVYAAFNTLCKDGFIPDIIHAHVFTAGLPAERLSRRYKIPFVITEHWSIFHRPSIRIILKIQARYIFNQARVIMPVSTALKEAIQTLGTTSRFEIIPNAIDDRIFYPPARREPSGKKRVLLVALLNPIKGVPYLLQAFSALKQEREDFFLDIVGDGPQKNAYETLTQQLGLQDVVCFHGFKTKLEVGDYMRRADFFVLPSEWENLPCVVLEAMTTGLPVVATTVGGLPEIIHEEQGVLCPPKNVPALRDAIRHMLDHSPEYSSAAIATYARNNFGYEIVGSRLNDIYTAVLEEQTQFREH